MPGAATCRMACNMADINRGDAVTRAEAHLHPEWKTSRDSATKFPFNCHARRTTPYYLIRPTQHHFQYQLTLFSNFKTSAFMSTLYLKCFRAITRDNGSCTIFKWNCIFAKTSERMASLTLIYNRISDPPCVVRLFVFIGCWISVNWVIPVGRYELHFVLLSFNPCGN